MKSCCFALMLFILPLHAVACPGCASPFSASAKVGDLPPSYNFHSLQTEPPLVFTVDHTQIKETPFWQDDAPIPLGRSNAVAIARTELSQHVKDAGQWTLYCTGLQQYGNTHWWFYVIQFQKLIQVTESHQEAHYISIPVLLNGKAANGKEIRSIKDENPMRAAQEELERKHKTKESGPGSNKLQEGIGE